MKLLIFTIIIFQFHFFSFRLWANSDNGSESNVIRRDDREPASPHQPQPIKPEEPGFDDSLFLTGSWGGTRKKMSESGFDFSALYRAEAGRNLTGSNEPKTSFLETLDLKSTFNFEKLLDWKDTTAYLYFLGTKGGESQNTPGANVGDAQGVSSIQSPADDFKLYELWFQKNFFENKISLLVGLHDLNSEFYVTDTSSVFFNSSFGIGRELSQTGVNGPSVFPYTSGALRLRLEPSKGWYWMSAVFGAQAGNPEHPKGTHIRFGGRDGYLLIQEGGFKSDGDLTSKYAFGSWIYTRTFDHLTKTYLDTQGNSNPAQSVSQGVYGLLDQAWSINVSTFLRYGVASTLSNGVKSNLGAGLVFKNFLGRETDSFGLAVTQIQLGDEQNRLIELQGGKSLKDETTFEMNYRIGLTKYLYLQPDFQYISHPGIEEGLKDATYAAIRLEVSF